LTGPTAPSGHSKQIRHWSLIRILYGQAKLAQTRLETAAIEAGQPVKAAEEATARAKLAAPRKLTDTSATDPPRLEAL
jgi:hypothetical protein